MKLIITENQYKVLLTESFKDRLDNTLQSTKEYAKKAVLDVSNQLGFNFRFLLTYAAGIGAVIEPVTKFIKGEFPNLSDVDVNSLAICAVLVVFYKGKDYYQIKEKIKSKGLNFEFESAISKADDIKEKIVDLLNILGHSVYTMKDIIAYTFLLPVLGMLFGVINKYGVDSEEFLSFLRAVTTSSLITASGTVIRDLLLKVAVLVERKKLDN
jgi:uncharacterized alkaline shock family protein YloU